jgi:glucose-6-phosphate isomerase
MKAVVWLIVLAAVAAIVYGLWRLRTRWRERSRASEERFATFISQAVPKTAAAPKAGNDSVVLQRLLLEAASKAGEAGEPALSLQLYAKLLARYPQTSFADQARAAVDAQKKKLAPGPKP